MGIKISLSTVSNFIVATLLTLASIQNVHATNPSNQWSQYHGPADGTARLEQGPGPHLRLAWSIDMLDPNDDLSFDGNIGFDQDQIYRHGTLIRSNGHMVYFRLASDYQQSRGHLWQLDPFSGAYQQWSSQPSDGQDHTNPRSTQLFEAPYRDSFLAFHAGAFYATNWGIFDIDHQIPYNPNELHNSHSVRGSRILGPGGRWAWKNNRGHVTWNGISYYQGGALYHWDDGNSRYVPIDWDHDNDDQTPEEPYDLALIDHAWDDNVVVLFAHDGHHSDGTPYDHSRYLVLAADRPEVLANVVLDSSEILHPDSPRQDTFHAAYATHTDTVNKLAVDGRYIYSIERTTTSTQRLVCRDWQDGFTLVGFIELPLARQRNISFCITDDRVYVQYAQEVHGYTKKNLTPDLSWGSNGVVTTDSRSIYHNLTYQFGMCSWTSPGTECYPQQTIATDNTYLYLTTDTGLLVLHAADGSLAFEHQFSSMPGKATYNSSSVNGIAGDIILLPSALLVSSRKDSSWMWCFRPGAELRLEDDGDIWEGQEDGEQISVTLLGSQPSFAPSVNPTNWTVTGLPPGVTVGNITRIDATHARITLQGNRSQDYNRDIFDLRATVSPDEFTGAGTEPVPGGGGVTFRALASITKARLTHDNSKVDLTFSRPIYGIADMSHGVALDDFTVQVTSNGGTVTEAAISTITDIYNRQLEGGEQVVRLHLTLNSVPAGRESITITPSEDDVIFDHLGRSVPGSETTGPLLLHNPDQVEIVTLQQGVSGYSGGQDAWYSKETNYGSTSYLRTWTNTDRNVLVAFDDLSPLAECGRVIGAELKLYAYDGSYLNDSDILQVYRLTQGWTESGVTLNTHNGTDPWEIVYHAPYPQFELPMSAVSRSGTDLSAPTWMELDISDAVNSWLSGSPNHGLILKVNHGNNAALYWYSNEYDQDISLRPKLQVYCSNDSNVTDRDGDGDVDGSDLADLVLDNDLGSLGIFSQEFGTIPQTEP